MPTKLLKTFFYQCCTVGTIVKPTDLGLVICLEEESGWLVLSSEREAPSTPRAVARLLWPLTGEAGRLLALLHCGRTSVGEDTLHTQSQVCSK